MAKFLWILILLGMCNHTYAGDWQSPATSVKTLFAWDGVMDQLGYERFNQDPRYLLPGFEVNQIYYRFFSQQSLFILRIGEKSLVKFPSGGVGKVLNYNNEAWAFLFYGFADSEIKNIFLTLQKDQKTSSIPQVLQWSFLPRAHASVNCDLVPQSSTKGIAQSLTAISGEGIMGCLSQVYSGGKKSLGGKVEGVQEIFNFDLKIKMPNISLEGIKKSWDGLTDFASNWKQHLDLAMKTAGDGLNWIQKLPFAEKMNLICNALGVLGVDAITKIFIGGIGGGIMLVSKIVSLLQRTELIKKVFEYKEMLMALGEQQFQKYKGLFDDFIQKALNGDLKDDDLKRLKELMEIKCDF